MICVLAGGVGAAKFLQGMTRIVAPADVTVVANTGDDTVLHGLHISPDLDTITYTLAGEIDPETGWGLRGETWTAMEALERYGGNTWFRLGDRDLATHLHRTARLADGVPLSTVTAEITEAWDLDLRLLPVTDEPLRTMLTVADGEIGFQDYFVRLRHDVPVSAVRFDGAASARPAPGVLAAIRDASTLVIAPSNPVVSIGPLLAVPGIRDAVASRRSSCVAISPIIAGAALKGPADRLLTELGHESSVVGVAGLYTELAATLVIDTADRELATQVESTGMRAVVAPTVMHDVTEAADLARCTLEQA